MAEQEPQIEQQEPEIDEPVKLLGMWASPFTLTVQVALRIKKLGYQYIEEDLSNKSSLLLEYNPVHKKVPVLVHNGKPIAESLVILEYIDEIWKDSPLLPQDPYDRAQSRFWAKFVHEKIAPWFVKLLKAQGEEQEQGIEEVNQHLEFLENLLKDKEPYSGFFDEFGYLDVVVYCMVYQFLQIEQVLEVEVINREKLPSFCSWLGFLSQVCLFTDPLPIEYKHIAFLKSIREAAISAPK